MPWAGEVRREKKLTPKQNADADAGTGGRGSLFASVSELGKFLLHIVTPFTS